MAPFTCGALRTKRKRATKRTTRRRPVMRLPVTIDAGPGMYGARREVTLTRTRGELRSDSDIGSMWPTYQRTRMQVRVAVNHARQNRRRGDPHGSLRIGCQRFDGKAARILRRWALASASELGPVKRKR